MITLSHLSKNVCNCILVAILLLLTSYPGLCTIVDTAPVPGDRIDHWRFSNVEHAEEKSVNLSSQKGKWTVLYFWNDGCSVCKTSIPNYNRYQKEFKDSLNVLLVGYSGSQYGHGPSYEATKHAYEKLRLEEGVDLKIAYDSTYFHSIGIYETPYVMIVDPNGVVKASTYSIRRKDIIEFFRGTTPELPVPWMKYEKKYKYNPQLPLLLDSNGASDRAFSYRSVISKWQPHYFEGRSLFISDTLFQLTGYDVKALYALAYLGIDSYGFSDSLYYTALGDPIVEAKDSLLLTNSRLNKNVYSYSLYNPKLKSDRSFALKSLQDDLNKYFGFKTSVEFREVPVLKLVFDSTVRSQTKVAGKPNELIEYSSSYELLRDVYNAFFFKENVERIVLLDVVNSKHRIRIDSGCDFTKISSLNGCLQKAGLKIVNGVKRMKILRIF